MREDLLWQWLIQYRHESPIGKRIVLSSLDWVLSLDYTTVYDEANSDRERVCEESGGRSEGMGMTGRGFVR